MRLPIISATLAVIAVLFVLTFSSSSTTVVITHATSTPVALIDTVPAPLVPITLPPIATSTPVPIQPIKVKALAPAAPSVAESTSIPSPPTPQPQASDNASLNLAASNLRAALVNIICYTSSSNLKPISGSGVLIDSRGIILTASHVAQYFLLKNYPDPDDVTCVIRTGSPATDAYYATPIYVSSLWINANPTTLEEAEPTGTGENDFALLGITASASASPLPSSFPSVPLSSIDPQVGDPVAIGSYGAQFLGTEAIESDLFPTLVFGSVDDRYTFSTNSVDVISLGGTAAAQEGSSGGGVVNVQGQLTGLITTSTTAGDTSTRNLEAITPRHIRASYLADTGHDLDSYIASRSLVDLISSFAPQAQSLANILIAHLGQ